MAAEPQVDAVLVNGPEMKVSHLSQFALTNSVHPVRVEIVLIAARHQYFGNY